MNEKFVGRNPGHADVSLSTIGCDSSSIGDAAAGGGAALLSMMISLSTAAEELEDERRNEAISAEDAFLAFSAAAPLRCLSLLKCSS